MIQEQTRGQANGVGVLPILQAGPLAMIMLIFLVVPLGAIFVVSFLDSDGVSLLPRATVSNYADVFGSAATWKAYLNTIKYATIVWAVTFLLGFCIAYFIAF